jgi:hypothetical protein
MVFTTVYILRAEVMRSIHVQTTGNHELLTSYQPGSE